MCFLEKGPLLPVAAIIKAAVAKLSNVGGLKTGVVDLHFTETVCFHLGLSSSDSDNSLITPYYKCASW